MFLYFGHDGRVMDETQARFYLAGLIGGDGHIERNRERIDIRIYPENFRKNIASLLNKFGIEFQISRKLKRIRITSREFVEKMENGFAIPRGRKSHIINVPLAVADASKNQKAAYVAGWFDAEAWLERDRRYRPPYPRLRFCVSNMRIRDKLLKLLGEFGIKTGSYQSGLRYCLDINGRKGVAKMLRAIPFRRSDLALGPAQ